ncbi:MAG: CAP domain-containing protein [Pirellulaceae bacterium]
MLDRNNQWRASAGMGPQRLHPALTRAAQDHANYMARTGSFSHHSNGGPLSRASRYGFQGLVRENIAMGQVTISEAFQSWRNSGGHWANICCDAPAAGFGYAIDSAGNGYWVGVYGYPTSLDDQREQAELAAEKAAEQPPAKSETTPTKPNVPESDAPKTEAVEQPAATKENMPLGGDQDSAKGDANSPPAN